MPRHLLNITLLPLINLLIDLLSNLTSARPKRSNNETSRNCDIETLPSINSFKELTKDALECRVIKRGDKVKMKIRTK